MGNAKEVDYTYKDIYDIVDQNTVIYCTVTIYTDGTEDITIHY